MKIIEPVSSALLITGCVYAAGFSQNSAFMHYFGVNRAFSQPAIDKIFYDGGMITFELFVIHLFSVFLLFVAVFIGLLFAALIMRKPLFTLFGEVYDKLSPVLSAFGKLAGFASLLYLIMLTYLSFYKGQADGEKMAKVFLDTCHLVAIKQDGLEAKGCAFNKDRDSIWYYTLDGGVPEANSKLLSELDQIKYLPPVSN